MDSTGVTIYRVANSKYGALSPPCREAGVRVHEWSRWDTAGRTIYGGSTAVAAFVEVLEYIRAEPPATRLSELFDDVEPDDAMTLAGQLARELPGCGGMAYRAVSRGWRQSRCLYELQLPDRGKFIDVTGAESIAALDRQCRPLLDQLEVGRLTLSELTNSADIGKRLTTGIATWIRERVVLEDGSRPHGIVYPSKWGNPMENWAMWLRRTDDGSGMDPVSVVDVLEIGQHIAPLQQAAKLRGLLIF